MCAEGQHWITSSAAQVAVVAYATLLEHSVSEKTGNDVMLLVDDGEPWARNRARASLSVAFWRKDARCTALRCIPRTQ